MLSEKLELEFNKQINHELFSAYLYLSMSAYFDGKNLKGFSNWMRIQFDEEQAHAMKMYDYVLSRGGKVILETIEKPANDWESFIAVFEEVFAHEKGVTAKINNLVNIALEDKDHASSSFLQWFVDEQVEEEATVEEILLNLKFIGDEKSGLLFLDKEVGARAPFNGIQEQ